MPGLGGDEADVGADVEDWFEGAAPAAEGADEPRRLTREGLRALLGVPFTEEQLDAVCAPVAPGVIVAGAGSGKTSVMAARVVWLVAAAGVPAEQILGLTFTRKAAGELAERVRQALARLRRARLAVAGSGEAVTAAGGPDTDGPEVGGPDVGGGPALVPDVEGALMDDGLGEPTVATYNSFASRLVADHALRLGLEPDCVLLPAAARYQLAAHVARSYRGRVEAFTGSMPALVEAVVALDGQCGEHLVDPDDLVAFDRRWLADVLAALERARARPNTATLVRDLRRLAFTARRRLELAELVKEYRAARRERELLDYGDQITLAAQLAEQVPEVGTLLRGQYTVVLLDEYQDTSVAQRRLLTGLFGGGHPVTAVGDPAQAIYGWRGASASNLDRFPEHFRRAGGAPSATYQLSVNQRSGGRLLTLANAVAERLPTRSVTVLRPRPQAALAGQTVVALHATWNDEVRWIAGQLAARVRAGCPPRECAVLARSWSDVPALVTALTDAGLPVEVLGLGGLLSKPEIADIRATLEVLDDPTANPSLVRLLTGPRLRLGPRDLAALGRRAVEPLRAGASARLAPRTPADALADAVSDVDPSDVVSLADALADPGEEISAEGARRVRAFAAELAALRAHVSAGVTELVHRVVEMTGLDVELELAAPRGTRGRENLAAFLRVAADFDRSAAGYDDASGRASLTSFLGFLRAGEQHERGLAVDVPGAGKAVQVLTMHGAKGLEWDVVAVPNISRGSFPDSTVGDRWITSPSVLPAPLRGDAEDLPEFVVDDDRAAFDRFADQCRAQAEHEERRLAYVAFTRARSTLICGGHWWGPTQKKPRGPSPFLDELREHARREGNGQVDHWADVPLEKTNPALETPAEYVWPAPTDPLAAAARRAVANAVRGLLAGTPAAAANAAAAAAGAPEARGAAAVIIETVAGIAEADHRAAMTAQERALLDALDLETRLLLDEELAARAPARRVPLPTGLTATQVMMLRADPDGLARELVRPLPRRPVPAASRGVRFHAWVEEIFDRRPLLDHEDLPGAEDEYLDDAELRALKDAFLAGPYGGRRPFAVETPFELPIGGRVVRGRVDAVYDLGGGRYEVVDWKTGATAADPVQLALYRLAWARLRGVPPGAVDAAFYYVRDSRVVRPALPTEADLAALLSPASPSGPSGPPGAPSPR
ncbi:ATP-dependent helicase [Frankia sp. CNm7]|uniref:DNA 3'-5' helicase n=1 Tax=Frankia nepalensis TaxID=1836974 RepID=A0A937UQ29_9ACTN|nr:ATP-dependent helicase [Frankia nepalensis]MBL7514558.1 ATP-dependent helicase [Frankia nepalensis]MBL7524405.1 ATP-dependent helicase [Frankia nepalensis]MBL7631454.1 ATP-dependent helicase [Frankia nepalensis]